MWFNLKRTLTGERYQTLARRLDRLQGLLRDDSDQSESDRYQDFKDFAHATGNGLSEVMRPDGERLFPSPSPAAASFAWPQCVGAQTEQFLHLNSGGQSYWVIVRPFSLRGQQLVLLAAAPEGANLMILHNFWRGLLASLPILLLISSAGGYWISRRALRPVDTVTASARSIGIRSLSERIPVAETGDELQRLAVTYNEMLERLEAAVKRLKQFTADASHELRGPLSFTRTVAEVALRNPRLDSESRIAFQDIVDESEKAARLLEQMLTLARSDAEPVDRPLVPLNLVDVVEETCGLAQRLAAEKSLMMNVSYPQQPIERVLGDFASIRRLLWILLDNSLKYTDAPGQIEVSLVANADNATICVRDTGVGIAPSDLPYIFDRFYRADPSRSQVEGNGLGLSIAKWIANIHHADISVTSNSGEGTTFTVIFPLCCP
ncbi:MAG TPA: ATP-binding protein [Acidobacteriaceae bacterium]